VQGEDGQKVVMLAADTALRSVKITEAATNWRSLLASSAAGHDFERVGSKRLLPVISSQRGSAVSASTYDYVMLPADGVVEGAGVFEEIRYRGHDMTEHNKREKRMEAQRFHLIHSTALPTRVSRFGPMHTSSPSGNRPRNMYTSRYHSAAGRATSSYWLVPAKAMNSMSGFEATFGKHFKDSNRTHGRHLERVFDVSTVHTPFLALVRHPFSAQMRAISSLTSYESTDRNSRRGTNRGEMHLGGRRLGQVAGALAVRSMRTLFRPLQTGSTTAVLTVTMLNGTVAHRNVNLTVAASSPSSSGTVSTLVPPERVPRAGELDGMQSRAPLFKVDRAIFRWALPVVATLVATLALFVVYQIRRNNLQRMSITPEEDIEPRTSSVRLALLLTMCPIVEMSAFESMHGRCLTFADGACLWYMHKRLSACSRLQVFYAQATSSYRGASGHLTARAHAHVNSSRPR
jgi:hypothetical protein